MEMSSSLKGLLGEQRVKSVLDTLKSYGVRYIDDASLPTTNGGVTQIDFIVFSPSIVACLEVKTWYGKIYVPNSDEHWRVVYKKQIIVPSNPLTQNDIHCRAAISCSPNNLRYNNLLVFPSDPLFNNKKTYTCNMTDLVEVLTNGRAKYSESILTEEYERLNQISIKNYDRLMDKEISRIIKNGLTTNFFGD